MELRRRAHWCKTHTTVAHHQSGNTVGGRWLEVFVPRDLAVVVRMYVNPTGGNDMAGGVDDLPSLTGYCFTNFGDYTVTDCDVGDIRACTRSIDDCSPTNNDVMHGATLPTLFGSFHRGQGSF